MQVICKEKQCQYPALVLPYDIKNKIDGENFVVGIDGFTIDAKMIEYCLTIEQRYFVYGLLFYEGQTRFLIVDNDQQPCFLAATLFRINQASLFLGWEIRAFRLIDSLVTVICDSMLIDSYDDLRDLIALKPSAIRRFLNYKEFVADYLI